MFGSQVMRLARAPPSRHQPTQKTKTQSQNKNSRGCLWLSVAASRPPAAGSRKSCIILTHLVHFGGAVPATASSFLLWGDLWQHSADLSPFSRLN